MRRTPWLPTQVSLLNSASALIDLWAGPRREPSWPEELVAEHAQRAALPAEEQVRCFLGLMWSFHDCAPSVASMHACPHMAKSPSQTCCGRSAQGSLARSCPAVEREAERAHQVVLLELWPDVVR